MNGVMDNQAINSLDICPVDPDLIHGKTYLIWLLTHLGVCIVKYQFYHYTGE